MTRIVPRLPFGYPTDSATGEPDKNASLLQRVKHGGLRSPVKVKAAPSSPEARRTASPPSENATTVQPPIVHQQVAQDTGVGGSRPPVLHEANIALNPCADGPEPMKDWSGHPAMSRSHSMVCDHDSYSPPIIHQGSDWCPMTILPAGPLGILDRIFALRPPAQRDTGIFTAMIKSLPELKQELPLDPKLAVAIASSATLRGVDYDSDRCSVEAAIVAQWDAGLQFNQSLMIHMNNMQLSDSDHKKLAIRMVDTYFKGGLIQPGDNVLDVGTSQGFVAEQLALRGCAVEAIEPFPIAHKQAFDKTLKLTAAQYIERNPGRKFSVVHAGNFHPTESIDQQAKTDVLNLARNMSDLTTDTGRSIFGVSSTDPGFASKSSQFYLRPILEQCFEEVTFKPPHVVGDALSIGGQMGVWDCKKPRRQALADQ